MAEDGNTVRASQPCRDRKITGTGTERTKADVASAPCQRDRRRISLMAFPISPG